MDFQFGLSSARYDLAAEAAPSSSEDRFPHSPHLMTMLTSDALLPSIVSTLNHWERANEGRNRVNSYDCLPSLPRSWLALLPRFTLHLVLAQHLWCCIGCPALLTFNQNLPWMCHGITGLKFSHGFQLCLELQGKLWHFYFFETFPHASDKYCCGICRVDWGWHYQPTVIHRCSGTFPFMRGLWTWAPPSNNLLTFAAPLSFIVPPLSNAKTTLLKLLWEA